LDIETSGLSEAEGAVILSAAFIFQQQVDDVRMEKAPTKELELVIKPTQEEWAVASPKALEVNGMTWDYLEKEGISLLDAQIKLVTWLLELNTPELNKLASTKVFCVGQNPKFDLRFLNHFMGDSLQFVGFPFDDFVDVIDIMKHAMKYDPTLKTKGGRYNGHSISQALNVEEEDKVHTAIGGARVVFRNYWALQNRVEAVISKYRKEVMSKNYKNAYEVPDGVTTLEEFKVKAKSLGWVSLDSTAGSHVFVDKEGQRLSYLAGAPPILVKL
jgi:hypothetical protein